jgi:histidinol-phosphatase (PHP family)
LIDETVELIKQKELIVEVNTRGLYKKRSDELFPEGYALQRIKDQGIPIVLSSDAHQPAELNMLFDETVAKLIGLGFKEVMFFDQGSWQSTSLA